MSIRFPIAILVATSVTFGLFFVMQSLVTNQEVRLEESEPVRIIDVVQDIQEQQVRRMERTVEKPPEPEAPPPEIETPQTQVEGPGKINLSNARVSSNNANAMGDINLGAGADGDYLPLVLVQPQFPRRAQERGVSGYCTVSLTVLEDGTVDPNSIVLVEEDPKGYFFRESRKAAAKFKYKPKVVNGVAQKVEGVTYRFRFDLADD